MRSGRAGCSGRSSVLTALMSWYWWPCSAYSTPGTWKIHGWKRHRTGDAVVPARSPHQLAEARLRRRAQQLDVVVARNDVDAVARGGQPAEGGEERGVPPCDPVERRAHRRLRRVDPPAPARGTWAGLEEVERVAEQEQVGVRLEEMVHEVGERVVVERVVVRTQMQVADDDDVAHYRFGSTRIVMMPMTPCEIATPMIERLV